ncbi:MlaD family protein [Conexibacter sp. SYSU D00693]|uniref:MlaD family protein n=1 Tax=Conexibacter sp. SYSU D00693 TaxID=2812560 RepID=UPI00196A662E|nr:MlaD family protein [Conexibacter sp. SYSU D00693]
MPKTGFTVGRVLTMVGFALSCFGLLLFLWLSFGGASPLKPKGYRVDVLLDEATQLSEQADVRISGVPVGKVVKHRRDGDRTRATLELQRTVAPLPSDTRVVARQKTLLGETYIELTPGHKSARPLPEGGTLARGQVQPTVELDEVLQALDAPSRRNLQGWLQSWEKAFDGRGQDLNDAVGHLPGLAQDGGDLLATMDAQGRAVRQLVRDAGTVLGTVGERDEATQELVQAGDEVLRTTAAQTDDLRATVRVLPSFMSALRASSASAQTLSKDIVGPLEDLRPVGRMLRSTLERSAVLGDDLRAVSRDIRPAIRAAKEGVPAATSIVRAAGPLMDRLDPLSRHVRPVASFLDDYRRQFTASWPSVAAATEPIAPTASGREAHYLRLTTPLWNEATALFPERLATNRANPYPSPGNEAREKDRGVREAFDCSHTSNALNLPALGPGAPPCLQQEPYTAGGDTGRFPKLKPAAP